jgi:hypothetical protein
MQNDQNSVYNITTAIKIFVRNSDSLLIKKYIALPVSIKHFQ